MIRRTDDTNGARYANSSGEPLERTENKEHYPIFRETGDYGRREIGISAAEEDSATAVEIGQATRRTSSTLPVRRCLGESSRYIWAYVSASRRLRFRAAVSVGLSIRVSQPPGRGGGGIVPLHFDGSLGDSFWQIWRWIWKQRQARSWRREDHETQRVGHVASGILISRRSPSRIDLEGDSRRCCYSPHKLCGE